MKAFCEIYMCTPARLGSDLTQSLPFAAAEEQIGAFVLHRR